MTAGVVAVMQPYFFPFAGYFRLMAAAETFVFLDDVQFPRRGRVHRCEVPGLTGETEWLTLPLARQPRDILIRDLAYADGARQELDRRLSRHDWMGAGQGPIANSTRRLLRGALTRPADDLILQLETVAAMLELSPRFLRSSEIAIDPGLTGADRIMAIVKAVGGRSYVNAPGGRALYDRELFAYHGIRLGFLQAYNGPHRFLLPALMDEEPQTLRRDIIDTASVDWL